MQWTNIKNSKPVQIFNRLANNSVLVTVVAVLTFIGHVAGADLLGWYAIALATIAAFLFHDDSFTAMSILIFAPCAISRQNAPNRSMAENSYYSSPVVLPQLIVLIVLLFAAFVFRMVMYKEYKRIWKRGRLTVSFLILFGVLLLGGIFSANQGFDNVGYGAMIGASMAAPYLYLLNTADFKRPDAFKRLAFALMLFGLTCAASIAHVYIVDESIRSFSANKSQIQIGWSGPNSTGTLLILTMPAALYLAIVSKRPEGYFAAAVANMLALVFTYSRAALLFGAPVFLAIVGYACWKARNTFCIRIYTAVCAVVCFIALIVLRDKLKEIFWFFWDSKLSDSGRFNLLRVGWEAFTHSPIFGVGQTYLLKQGHWYYSFHNTVCHYLFTCGIFGLLGYGYHRFRTVQLFWKKPTQETLCLAAMLLLLLGNGLLDICMVNGIPLMLYSILLAFAEKMPASTNGALPADDTVDAIETAPDLADKTDAIDESASDEARTVE